MKKFFIILFFIFNFSIVNVLGNSENLVFTNEEIEYISNHETIKTGVDPAFVPYEFIDDEGNLLGIGPDYLEIIENKTGLKFEIMQGLTWQEVYQKAIEGEILVLPTVSKTDEREQYFNFSDAYYELTRVIVISQDNTTIKDFEDLKHLTVAVQRSSSHHSFLFNYPEINLSLYDDTDVALSKVATGNEVAFLASLATVSHFITTKGFTNLRMIAIESLDKNGIHFAVSKDEPVLLSIINKALNNITIEEKKAIHEKWITYSVDVPVGPWLFILLIIVSLFIVIFIVSMFWISKLRKEIKKKKEAQQELENANNVKQIFLARMSHELRTPIHAISGMSYLLQNSGLNMKQSMYSERISQASVTMLNIVNDILDYSKFTSGKVELEKESFCLNNVINNVLQIITFEIDEKGIRFIYKEDTTLSNWYIGDQYRLEQILINLLNNAIKFCNETSVNLEIENLGIENDIQELKFIISDTGIGMTESQIKALFVPFIQADSSITRRFGGTGLGLSIVKELVDMMGGTISVESKENEGTSFIVTIKFMIDLKKEEENQSKLNLIKKNKYKALLIGDNNIENNITNGYLEAVDIKSKIVDPLNFVENDFFYDDKINFLFIDYNTASQYYEKLGSKLRELLIKNVNLRIILLIPTFKQELNIDFNKGIIHYAINKPIIRALLYNVINNLFSNKNNHKYDKKISHLLCSDKNSILVVDDNLSNQIIVSTILRDAGYDVYIAEDGISALKVYKKHNEEIKIILMDLHMPNMDGYETAREIYKIGYKYEIIAMTADVIPGVISKCRENGMNYSISKPFEPEKLVSLVYQIIKQDDDCEQINNSSIDFSLGLKYMGEDIKLYNKVLLQFYEDNKINISLIKDFLDNKSYNEARDLIHKMKSSSGSIGATLLLNICNQFQNALESRNIEEIKKLNISFNIELENVLKAIASKLKIM
ncbi:MAG: transporter substrate-binding domain-containing protein [Bacilli bacterium]|nr:transporter substrate-binding domain-containing protein [Bacilli bacterium]MDD2681911.1 transporter substrate-binding domain-containing protein [Bacilli bacterium]MDD3121645.1 transporter substrate-binding domain-containing protein [Bacilli bacterium]